MARLGAGYRYLLALDKPEGVPSVRRFSRKKRPSYRLDWIIAVRTKKLKFPYYPYTAKDRD